MQYEIADCVHAEEIYQIIRIQHVSFGFAHLAITLQQPGMTEYLLGQGLIQCHQENRPVNCMEADDIFSDQMQISRPKLFILLAAVAFRIVADTGNIVGQRIQPYINNVFLIEINRDTPFERGSGNAQILQSGKQEIVHHLVFAGYRLDKFRMAVDMVDQALRIFAHSEEICFFLCRFHFSAAVRTFPVL